MSDGQIDARDKEVPVPKLSDSQPESAPLSADNSPTISTVPGLEWTGEISTQIEQLRSTMQSSEDGFLSIGSQLNSIHSSAKSISRNLAELLGNYSTEGRNDLLVELQTISDRSSKQLDRFSDFSTNALHQMQTLRDPLLSLPDLLEEFDRLVSRLRMMGVTARIESARVGSDGLGFVHLASEVSSLGEQITAKAKEVSSYVDGISGTVDESEHKLSNVIDGHNDLAARVSLDMRSNLQILDEKREMSKRTLSGISTKSEEALRNVHVVVQSIQYHDITRQQVEHIVEALQSIREQDSIVEIVPICELQAAHLRRAGTEFENAILSIVKALGALSDGVTMMLSESEQMTSFTKESGNTFFDLVERGLEIVMATLSEDRVSIVGLTSSLKETTENILKMKSFMDEMANVGSDIELLALNSRVKAAKTGRNGAGLGVIAESIQRLSEGAREQINRVIAHMSDMVGISNELSDAQAIDGVTHQAEIETQDIINRLKSASQLFDSNNKVTTKIFQDMEQVCSSIVTQLDSLTDQISKHRQISVSLLQVGKVLEDLAGQLRASLPDSARMVMDRRIEELRERYTMETERLTHNEVMNREHTQSQSSSPGNGSIELF